MFIKKVDGVDACVTVNGEFIRWTKDEDYALSDGCIYEAELSGEEIIEKYAHVLSEEQIDYLKQHKEITWTATTK